MVRLGGEGLMVRPLGGPACSSPGSAGAGVVLRAGGTPAGRVPGPPSPVSVLPTCPHRKVRQRVRGGPRSLASGGTDNTPPGTLGEAERPGGGALPFLRPHPALALPLEPQKSERGAGLRQVPASPSHLVSPEGRPGPREGLALPRAPPPAVEAWLFLRSWPVGAGGRGWAEALGSTGVPAWAPTPDSPGSSPPSALSIQG